MKHYEFYYKGETMTVDREKYMSKDEVKQLRTITEGQSILDLKKGRVKGVIAWMLVDLALSTGLRVLELAAIKIEDVDFKRGSLKVIRVKKRNRKVESLAIGKDLVKHLKEYIDWTGRIKGPLFEGQRGTLSRAGLQQVWKAVIKRAGLPSEISIHCARHTLAVHLLKKTGNLRQVQKQLGHASPAVTANMYADITFEDMQDGVNSLYPATA
jgi:Site-specific recombinase XerD